MRSLQSRLALAKKNGTMTEELEYAISSPMRKLRSIFPNSPLGKHTPFDIYLAAPVAGRPRALVFRDMGSIEDDWVATEFVLHYFEGEGPSPPVRSHFILVYPPSFLPLHTAQGVSIGKPERLLQVAAVYTTTTLHPPIIPALAFYQLRPPIDLHVSFWKLSGSSDLTVTSTVMEYCGQVVYISRSICPLLRWLPQPCPLRSSYGVPLQVSFP